MSANHPPRPAGPIRHPSPGFTLVEIVVVMLLMSIVTAVVLGRSITTSEVDVAGQTDKIRNQLRYAQSMAMKRSDSVWGIRFAADSYWFFRKSGATTEEIQLPGGEYDSSPTRIDYSELGIGVSATGLGDSGTVIFDDIGKPYTAYESETANTPLTAPAEIGISAAGAARTIRITPETGLIE